MTSRTICRRLGDRRREPRRARAPVRVGQLVEQARHHPVQARARPSPAGAARGAPPRRASDLRSRHSSPAGRRAVAHEGHPTTPAPPPAGVRAGSIDVVRVSTRGDYASRALLSLALHGAETPTSVRDIAERTGLPQPYLEQILLALKGAGLVRSKRGVGGGYVLARPPEEISLAQIVSAVDGPIAAGDFGEPHENGACDHEGQCVLLGRLGRRGRDHPHPPAVLQPGRHGRPGPGQRAPPRSEPSSSHCASAGSSALYSGRAPGSTARPPARSRSHPSTHDGAGIEEEEAPGDRGQAEPAGGQHPQEVAVGHAERVAGLTALARSITRSARRPTSAARSPPGTPSLPEGPAGPLLADLVGGDALVGAVVPLHEVGVASRPRTRPACRSPRPAAGGW